MEYRYSCTTAVFLIAWAVEMSRVYSIAIYNQDIFRANWRLIIHLWNKVLENASRRIFFIPAMFCVQSQHTQALLGLQAVRLPEMQVGWLDKVTSFLECETEYF